MFKAASIKMLCFKSLPLFTLVSFAVFNCIVVEGTVVVKRSEFGEHCNETFKCNRNSWLTCQNENCNCAFPDEMVFDPTGAKCVAKAGERCKFGTDDTIYQKSDCVHNANCGAAGICTCDPFHYEIANGTCQELAEIGETCLNDLTCRRDKHIKCILGTCGCDPDVTEVSNDGRCVGLAGKDCLSHRCTPNAACQNVTNTCMCVEGYYPDDQGRCNGRKDHGELCAGNFECQSFLSCMNGSCSCDPTSSTFATANKEVTIPSTGVPNVVVKPSSTSTSFSCNSRTTTTLISDKLYIHSPNYPTNYSDNFYCYWLLTVDPGQTIRLAFDDFRFEISDTCQYDTLTIYDGDSTNAPSIARLCGSQIPSPVISTGNKMYLRMATDGSASFRGFKGQASINTGTPRRVPTNECVGLAGKACSSNKNCVKNAECSSSSTCVCKAGYLATSGGRCGVSLGATCDETENVCSDAFVCTDGTCACHHPDHQVADGDKCLSIISGPCSNNTDCIQGAQCNWDNTTSLGFCTCKEGLVENAAGKCDVAFAQTCTHRRNECDTYAGLKCRNGLCKCPDDSYHFDHDNRRCVGLVHSRCSKDGKMKDCVEHAQCVGTFGVCKCKGLFEETNGRMCIGVA